MEEPGTTKRKYIKGSQPAKTKKKREKKSTQMPKKKKEHSFDIEQNHSGKAEFLLKDMELVQI